MARFRRCAATPTDELAERLASCQAALDQAQRLLRERTNTLELLNARLIAANERTEELEHALARFAEANLTG